MKPDDYFQLLKGNDLPSTEEPLGFDRLNALQEVEEIQSSLESYFGYKPILDPYMQDATHFAELQMQPKISREVCAVIRFSRFGKLVTILFPDKLDNEQLSIVLRELKR